MDSCLKQGRGDKPSALCSAPVSQVLTGSALFSLPSAVPTNFQFCVEQQTKTRIKTTTSARRCTRTWRSKESKYG